MRIAGQCNFIEADTPELGRTNAELHEAMLKWFSLYEDDPAWISDRAVPSFMTLWGYGDASPDPLGLGCLSRRSSSHCYAELPE